ncbi:MAG TPA: MarR family winged helix-turn-helix transcriptional regulator, partial [Candidatus Limnocylindria bacterium]|nr:MarR family winged helix-turn-helix transcriptional regulator [Candidatus Limnocylindria bacterium]
QRELGETMAIDHSILVTMLNPLEADGLIERKRSGTDRRRHVVTVTPAASAASPTRRKRNAKPRTRCSPARPSSSAINSESC